MLDDQHGVAPVAQELEQLGQPMHVARVESDARLVEDVHDVDQAAAEMLDELDALRLATGERVGLAVETEVVEPDVGHVLQTLDERADDRLAGRVGHQSQHGDEVADLHRCELRDVVPVDLRTERRLAQPGAPAQWARPLAQERLDLLLGPLRGRLEIAPHV